MGYRGRGTCFRLLTLEDSRMSKSYAQVLTSTLCRSRDSPSTFGISGSLNSRQRVYFDGILDEKIRFTGVRRLL